MSAYVYDEKYYNDYYSYNDPGYDSPSEPLQLLTWQPTQDSYQAGVNNLSADGYSALSTSANGYYETRTRWVDVTEQVWVDTSRYEQYTTYVPVEYATVVGYEDTVTHVPGYYEEQQSITYEEQWNWIDTSYDDEVTVYVEEPYREYVRTDVETVHVAAGHWEDEVSTVEVSESVWVDTSHYEMRTVWVAQWEYITEWGSEYGYYGEVWYPEERNVWVDEGHWQTQTRSEQVTTARWVDDSYDYQIATDVYEEGTRLVATTETRRVNDGYWDIQYVPEETTTYVWIDGYDTVESNPVWGTATRMEQRVGTRYVADGYYKTVVKQVQVTEQVWVPVEPTPQDYSAFLEGLYQTYLGRSSDADGLAWWNAAMQNGTSAAAVEEGFKNSPEAVEYRAKLAADAADVADAQLAINAEAIRGFYLTYFGREPEPGGVDFYLQAMRNGSTAAEIESAIGSSPEAQQYASNTETIRGFFLTYLGREPLQAGLDHYLSDMRAGKTDAQVEALIASSPEAIEYAKYKAIAAEANCSVEYAKQQIARGLQWIPSYLAYSHLVVVPVPSTTDQYMWGAEYYRPAVQAHWGFADEVERMWERFNLDLANAGPALPDPDTWDGDSWPDDWSYGDNGWDPQRDPAMQILDASGQPVPGAYDWKPAGAVATGENPGLVQTVSSALGSIIGTVGKVMFAVDEESLGGISDADIAQALGNTPELRGIGEDSNSVVIIKGTRDTGLTGYYNFATFKGTDANGTPLFDPRGMPVDTHVITYGVPASALTGPQQKAISAGWPRLPAELAAQLFPESPTYQDPIQIGDGMLLNPVTGRVMMPKLAVGDPALGKYFELQLRDDSPHVMSAPITGVFDKIAGTAATFLDAMVAVLGIRTDPYSDDYDKQNDLFLFKSERRTRALDLLNAKNDRLQVAAQKYNVNPQAIAAAIAWEFSENVGGYMSDALGGYVNTGYGFGSIHDDTLRKEMITNISLAESIRLRGNLDSAIDLVAMRMDQQAKTYQDISGINVRYDMVALTWMFNTSSDYIKRAAETQAVIVARGEMPSLNIINNMAFWTHANQGLFGFAFRSEPLAGADGVNYVHGSVNPATR